MSKRLHRRGVQAGKIIYSATDVVARLDALQKGFRRQHPDSSPEVEVFFGLLPESEDRAYFAGGGLGLVGEHGDLVVSHPKGGFPGNCVVRGDMRGGINDTSEESYIRLKLPVDLNGYTEMTGVSSDILTHWVNDLILSARLLLKGGVPPAKRLVFDPTDEDEIQAINPEVFSAKTIGDLAGTRPTEE